MKKPLKKLRKKGIILDHFLIFLSEIPEYIPLYDLKKQRIIGVVIRVSGSGIVVRKAGKWIKKVI